MRILVKSRKGHFNMCNSSQESISTHIAIYDNEEKIIMYGNITTEYELSQNDNDPENLADEIDNHLGKLLYCSDKKELLSLAKFLRDNADKLLLGNKKYLLSQYKEKYQELEKKIEKLEEEIIHLEISPEITKIQEGLKEILDKD